MKRLNINILGVCEHRWPGNGEMALEGGKFYYSGNTESNHRNGVGIVVDRKYAELVTGEEEIMDERRNYGSDGNQTTQQRKVDEYKKKVYAAA